MSWAVVTGASGGIGLEMVRALAEREPNLHFLLIARREEQLKELRDELRSKKVAAEYMVLDLSRAESSKEIEDKIRKSGYAVRHLINNAGFGWWGRFDEQSVMNIEQMIAVNVTTLTVLTRRLIPLMETEGRIVNVASSAGFAPIGGFAVYAATKAFVLNFSLALDAEIRKTRDITVSAICPGPVETEFWSSAHVPAEDAPSSRWRERPAVTARRAIKGSARGRALIPTGFAAWGIRFASWLAPRRFFARSMMASLSARD